MHGLRSAAVAVALVLANGLSPDRLHGQELSPSFSSLQYTASLPPELGDTARKYPRTYWLEGALLTGIPLGILGAALGAGLCGDPDSGGQGPCWDDGLLGLATGLGVGASLGGLIGGLIKKPEKQEAETLPDNGP
jgi:hypothetical protein